MSPSHSDRFRTTICSKFLPALELYPLASRGQYISATGQRVLEGIFHSGSSSTPAENMWHWRDYSGTVHLKLICHFTAMTLRGQIAFLLCLNFPTAERFWWGKNSIQANTTLQITEVSSPKFTAVLFQWCSCVLCGEMQFPNISSSLVNLLEMLTSRAGFVALHAAEL